MSSLHDLRDGRSYNPFPRSGLNINRSGLAKIFLASIHWHHGNISPWTETPWRRLHEQQDESDKHFSSWTQQVKGFTECWAQGIKKNINMIFFDFFLKNMIFWKNII